MTSLQLCTLSQLCCGLTRRLGIEPSTEHRAVPRQIDHRRLELISVGPESCVFLLDHCDGSGKGNPDSLLNRQRGQAKAVTQVMPTQQTAAMQICSHRCSTGDAMKTFSTPVPRVHD